MAITKDYSVVADAAGNGYGVELRGSVENFAAKNAISVTPSDTADLAEPVRSFYVSGAGAVKVTTVGGQDITFANIPVGQIQPLQVRRIWATGTAATGIVGLV